MEATLIIITGCLTAALTALSRKWGKEQAVYEYELQKLRERLESLEEVIRRKNAYAKELENHLLENAVGPDRLADVLTGMFVAEEGSGGAEDMPAERPTLEAPGGVHELRE